MKGFSARTHSQVGQADESDGAGNDTEFGLSSLVRLVGLVGTVSAPTRASRSSIARSPCGRHENQRAVRFSAAATMSATLPDSAPGPDT